MMTTKAKLLYKPRAVAFIDLLGFQEHVLALHENNQDDLQKVYQALQTMKRVKPNEERISKGEMIVTCFSDSVVLSSEPKNVAALIWRVGWLQAELLLYGILLRGGIAIGKTVHQNEILFGEGMVKAYHYESKVASYPRIVIEDAIIAKLQNDPMSLFISTDFDGCSYVDVFQFKANVPGAERLAADGYDPRQIYLKEVHKKILKGIESASKPEHKSKWKWLLFRYENYRKGPIDDFLCSLEKIKDLIPKSND